MCSHPAPCAPDAGPIHNVKASDSYSRPTKLAGETRKLPPAYFANPSYFT